MIIDIHTHYGVIEGGYQMPLDMQLSAMEEYGIDYALISNIECGILHEGIEGNRKLLQMVRQHSNRLGGMLWCCENLTAPQKEEFEQMYLENTDLIKGLKIHADIANCRADDICFGFFYQFARKYHLPVLFHTQDSPFSKVEYVANVAKKFPDVKLILGHMGLGSDGEEALEALQNHENLYGDTAWVKAEVLEKAKKTGVFHKMMFGTDSPISGKHCYGDECYRGYAPDEMCDHAKQVFRL